MGIKLWLVRDSRSIRKSNLTSMSVKILVLSVGFIAILGVVHSATTIMCYEGTVADGKTMDEGKALLTAKECGDGITMCKNYTATTAGVAGTIFMCGTDADTTKGCTTKDSVKTCICEGAKCNTYSSAPMAISTPAMLVFTLIVSGLSFVF